MSHWVQHSYPFYPFLSLTLNYVSLGLTASILAHSAIINWKRPLNNVRVLTDVAVLAYMVENIIIICLSLNEPKVATTTVLADVFAFCMLGGLVQLCDNYTFYFRFRAVMSMKIPRWKSILIHLFIWFVLMFSWIPVYTLIPFFMDVNSVSFNKVNYNFILLQSWAGVAFNFYFSVEFVNILNEWRRGKYGNITWTDKKIMVSIKSLVHCCITGATGVLWLWYPAWGPIAYSWSILICLHFLFNWKVDRLVFANVRIISSSDEDAARGSGNSNNNNTSCCGCFWRPRRDARTVMAKVSPADLQRDPEEGMGGNDPPCTDQSAKMTQVAPSQQAVAAKDENLREGEGPAKK